MLATATQDLLVLAEALLALLFGGLIGFEREAAGKWAGRRTHMLVCLATFLFVETGQAVTLATAEALGGLPEGVLRADPIRLVQSITVGVSFVGAGVIFRDPERNVARGLTTTAALPVAPVGVAVAAGHYVRAGGAAVLVVVVRVLNRLERKRFGPERADAD